MNWKALKSMSFKEKLFVIFILTPMFFLFMGIAKSLSRRMEVEKRYKKVIKKGLLWDTEYFIEK